MFDLDLLTRETLDVAKAITSGITTGTGIAGIDLSGLVSLVPVNTPARNKFSRTDGSGSTNAQWKALLNINSQQSDVAVGLDFAGHLVQFDEQDVFAPYVPFATGVTVTQDSMDIAKDYADVKAIGVLQALLQLQIGEDIHILNSQRWALPTPGTPTLADVTTGGTVPHSTVVHVKVAARSGWNYYYGGSTIGSAAGTITTGSGVDTRSITGLVDAVQGAVAYDWFVATASGSYYYYTTTVTNTVTITSLPVANEALPALPLLSATAPTAVPVTNTSNSANNYNGVLASTLGDYGSNAVVAPGAGVASGAVWHSLDGAPLTMSGGGITQLDSLLLALWNSVQLSPDALMMSATEAQAISNLVLDSASAVTFLQPMAGERTNIAAGGYVGSYVNRAGGGVPVAIEVHPHLAPGTVVARTDKVPFPGANISNVFDVRTLRDYTQFDYGVSRVENVAGGGPRQDSEVRLMSTLRNHAPSCQAVLSNIGQD